MACPTGAVPSFAARYGYPSTVEAVEAAKLAAMTGCPSTFGGVNPMMTGVPTGYPTIFSPINNMFSGYPSSWMTGYPTSFSGFGGYPTNFDRFGGNFGGYPSSWMTGYPTNFDRFGGYLPWTANFGGMPSTLERFGGYPSGSEFYGRNYENINSNLYTIGFRPSSSIECYTLTNPIRVLDREGNRMVWLCFDLKGYKPEEITVTLNKAERAVVVEAAHEAKDGKEHHVIRKFCRKFVLPETLAKVDLTKVELKSCLNVEGLLSVEIALPKMTAEEIAKCSVTSRHMSELPFAMGGFTGSHFSGLSPYHGIGSAKPVTVKTA